MIKERNSNIELMRIVSMLMILNLHSMSGPSINDSFIWQTFDFFRESVSICAIHLFVLASGYFGIKWKMKSFSGLLFQILFYFWIIIGVCSLLSIGKPIEASGWQLAVMPFTQGWWFVTSYLLLYIIAPLLNYTNSKLPLYGRVMFVLAVYVISIKFDYKNIELFASLYLTGSILKTMREMIVYKFLFDINLNRIGYWVLTSLIASICLYLFALGIMDVTTIKGKLVGWSYSNPLIMLQSVCLFNIFNDLDIRNSWINKAAISVLAVYLIHMHPCIKEYYYSFAKSLYEMSHIMHIAILLIFLPTCLVICLLVDRMRIFVFDKIYDMFN